MRKKMSKQKRKTDWSRASRPHQVQDAQALVKRGKAARQKRKEEGRQFEDQSP